MNEHHHLFPISVVMSVYDNAEHVRRTIDSVLAQQNVEFELVVVSDGAETAVQKLLQNISDARVSLIFQENLGLTKALINACDAAKHPLIARIDAGDVMLDGRLCAQAKILSDNPNVGLVGCWVRLETEEGYYLYTIGDTSEQMKAALRATEFDSFRTPFHASMMFRKSIYTQVGGYRADFYFAQDADLWSRMAWVSDFKMLEQTLTKAIFSINGISGRYNIQQQALKKLIVEGNGLRAMDQSDESILELARLHGPMSVDAKLSNVRKYEATYFLAKVLHDRKSHHAHEYWARALKIKPWSLKAWAFVLLSLFARSDPSKEIKSK